MNKKDISLLNIKLNEAIERNDDIEAKRILEMLSNPQNVKYTGYASIDKPHNIGASKSDINPFVPGLNIYSAIKALNSFYKDETAIESIEIKASYGKLFEDAKTISLALKELGVKKGQIVSVSMPNLYQAVAIFLACNRIGAVTTFLNYFAPEEEIISYLNIFESPIYFNLGKTAEDNRRIKNNTHVKNIVTLNSEDINNLSFNRNYLITSNDYKIDFCSLNTIAKCKKNKIERYHGIKENALILFTSGTTGKPKSVVLSNENIISAAIYLKNSSNIKDNKDDKRTLVCVPFSYPYGFATSTLMTLLSNKTAILAPDISKNNISNYLALNPNIIFGSPALLELIMKNTPENQDLSSIKQFISGGDFLTPYANNRGKEFFEKHNANVELGNGSGNAETVSCGTNPLGVKNRPETAGRLLVGTNAMIVDPETMQEKKYGEEGLLLVSGRHVFKEYYNNPKLTNESMVEINGIRYFKTGTMGFLDKEGYFTITGRQSRFYIMDSLNKVYLDKVQSIISALPCVDDVAVVSVPDEDKLYVNKAYIILNEKYNKENMDDFILTLCEKPVRNSQGDLIQLKPFEIPSYIEFVEELPRKRGTDKIDYSLLEKDAKIKHCKQKVI